MQYNKLRARNTSSAHDERSIPPTRSVLSHLNSPEVSELSEVLTEERGRERWRILGEPR